MTQEPKSVVEFKNQAYDVETQVPDISREAIETANKVLGYDYRGAQATIEIARDSIKAYCNYMGSTNPLFLDEGYARKTRWGGTIAPPTMLGIAMIAPGLRGVQWIAAGREWEIHNILRPGDVVTQRGRYIKAVEKRGGVVPLFLVQTGETLMVNQRNEMVAKAWVSFVRSPRRQAKGGMNYKPRTHKWTEEELAKFEQTILSERPRGATPLYWEDVAEGEPMAPVIYGPLRMTEIALAGAFNDSGSFSGEGVAHLGAHVYQLLNRRRHPADSYVDPETGVQDHPHRGHWERHMAREVGMPGIYDVGNQRVSWLCRYIYDWMGDDAFLRRLGGILRRPNVVGDVTWVRGRIVKKWTQDGEHLVRCDLWAENQLGDVTLQGYAVVRLLSRTVETSNQGGPQLL